MPSQLVVALFAALLLHWYQVTLAAKVGGKGTHTKIRLIVRLYDLQHCKDKPHFLFVRNTSSRVTEDGTEYIDMDYELTEPAETLSKMTFIMHRCPLGVGGKCEYYDTWTFKRPCAILNAKGMIWTPMIDASSPRFQCPLIKGPYKSRNVTVDIGALGPVLDGVNADKFSWPFEVQYHTKERLHSCFTVVGYPIRVRARVH